MTVWWHGIGGEAGLKYALAQMNRALVWQDAQLKIFQQQLEAHGIQPIILAKESNGYYEEPKGKGRWEEQKGKGRSEESKGKGRWEGKGKGGKGYDSYEEEPKGKGNQEQSKGKGKRHEEESKGKGGKGHEDQHKDTGTGEE